MVVLLERSKINLEYQSKIFLKSHFFVKPFVKCLSNLKNNMSFTEVRKRIGWMNLKIQGAAILEASSGRRPSLQREIGPAN